MGHPSRPSASRVLSKVGAAFVLLLAVRFFASVALSALGPPPETLAVAGHFLEAYEIVLPAAILPVTFLLALGARGRTGFLVWLAILGVHVTAYALWLASLLGVLPTLAFAPLAVVAVILAGGLVIPTAKGPRRLMGGLGGLGYLTLLVVVALAFSLRVGAALGLGTSPGPGGVLEGSWVVSNLPTLLMELLAVGVWLAVVLGATGRYLRRRWHAFLPFAVLPAVPLVFWARPLAGYIFSATVTWGSNLVVFVPAIVSLTLVAVAIACYLSTFLLVPRKGNDEAWGLALLGTLSVILAGFYLSMASVEGLVWGLLLTARGLRRWVSTPT